MKNVQEFFFFEKTSNRSPEKYAFWCCDSVLYRVRYSRANTLKKMIVIFLTLILLQAVMPIKLFHQMGGKMTTKITENGLYLSVATHPKMSGVQAVQGCSPSDSRNGAAVLFLRQNLRISKYLYDIYDTQTQ